MPHSARPRIPLLAILRRWGRRLGALLTTAAVLLQASPAFADQHRRWGANYFPNVELTTHEGKTVRFYDDLLKGKSVGINAIFTTCKDVCPLETANLVQLYKVLGARVGKDVFLYSISIDPKRDTPEVLKAYAEKFGAGGPGWLFLTGKPEDIKLIMKKLALIRDRDNPTSRDSHHAAYLMIGDEPNGQWTRHSVVDNPRFLAARMGTLLGWREPESRPELCGGKARYGVEWPPAFCEQMQRLPYRRQR